MQKDTIGMANGANSLARAKWNCAYHTKSPLKQSHCLPAVLSFSKKSLTSRRTGERVPPLLHLPVLLKSFGFSGAKTTRKRFFALGNEIFRRFQSSRVRRTRRRARLEAQESFGHIELSEGFFDIAIACRQYSARQKSL